MRRNIDGTCSPSCCSNPNIRTINTMNADTSGNFTIRGDQGIHVTVGTNEVIISGIAVYYDNLDGNLVIDNDAMTIDFAEDIVITGDLTVNGTYYTVHAEHVYTEDDYIIMRNGAVTGLGSGDFSGFQVKLYDGVNDGRLVMDKDGVARVGDVGDEQPLLTRDESADLTNGNLLEWDGTNQKAIDAGIPVSNVALTSMLPTEGTNIIKFPNGLKIMWGTKNTNANDTIATITFPEAFTTTTYTVTAIQYDKNGQNLWSFYCNTRGKSTTGIDISLCNVGGNGWSVASAIDWIAIGY